MSSKKTSQGDKWDNQNYVQLAGIQSASIGLSGIIIGQQLAAVYGIGIAICSIAVGNLILWLIAIVIISMVDRANANAIDNFTNYIGKYGGILVSLFLMLAFLNWYSLEINSTISEFNDLFQLQGDGKNSLLLKSGAALGLMTALISIGGIRLIKWITLSVLPFLFLYHFFSVLTSNQPLPDKASLGLSFSAVIICIMTELPGVINFPTFFRHSRSKAHSYLALTILTIFITFFQTSTIWMRFSSPLGTNLSAALGITTAFVIILLICSNLLNIYFASACWDAVVPRFGGPKGFAIIGMIGTTIYTFIQISPPMLFLLDLTNSYIGCLGVALLLGFLIRVIVKHRPRPFEQSVNMATWMFGCVIATIYEAKHPLQGVDALLAGVNASIVFLLITIFMEETSWALKHKFGKWVMDK